MKPVAGSRVARKEWPFVRCNAVVSFVAAPVLHRCGWLAHLLDVTLSPNPGSLPGGNTLQDLTNGIAGWALILSLVSLVIGAAAWALGAHSQNYHQSYVGRRTVLVSGFAALIIGAAPTLINFFFHTGTGLH
jgi:hypothetical protein